jgi:hypothetical protein
MRFDYIPPPNTPHILMPLLPLIFTIDGAISDGLALVDSGSTINVLPYSVGLSLGAVWENQSTQMQLTGNLSQFEARGLFVYIAIPSVTQDLFVRLLFAWTKADIARPILGQTNFFDEFDVCFFKSDTFFDVTWKNSP